MRSSGAARRKWRSGCGLFVSCIQIGVHSAHDKRGLHFDHEDLGDLILTLTLQGRRVARDGLDVKGPERGSGDGRREGQAAVMY